MVVSDGGAPAAPPLLGTSIARGGGGLLLVSSGAGYIGFVTKLSNVERTGVARIATSLPSSMTRGNKGEGWWFAGLGLSVGRPGH